MHLLCGNVHKTLHQTVKYPYVTNGLDHWGELERDEDEARAETLEYEMNEGNKPGSTEIILYLLLVLITRNKTDLRNN